LKARWASNASQVQTRIVKGVVRGHRVLHGALPRLEPGAVKVARRVLRGRGGGNVTPLPDKSERNLLAAEGCCPRWPVLKFTSLSVCFVRNTVTQQQTMRDRLRPKGDTKERR